MEINDRIAENTGLVYARLKEFGLRDDQDAESLAYEALYNAAKTFDESTGTLFTTYAVCCINNAIRVHIRTLNRKRQLELVSYDAPVTGAENSISLADVLMNPISLEQYIESEEACKSILKAVYAEYALLSERDKTIISMLYTSDRKITQREIASVVGLTQVSVNLIIKAFKHRVKQRMEEYK